MEEKSVSRIKPKKTPDEVIELIVVIMLGVTALFTAWGSWIGSLHGGNQATSYTTSNNLASEGNSEYNAGIQQMNQDMLLWNDISDMQMEISFAQENGDAYGLVTVIYSVVLFLLGIVSSFSNTKNKQVIVIVSLVAFLFDTIYMFTIPMPTGFDITSFFG